MDQEEARSVEKVEDSQKGLTKVSNLPFEVVSDIRAVCGVAKM